VLWCIVDHSLVYEHLKHPRFEHLESEEGAQVVWPTWHIKDFQKYAADERVQIINQFPNEKILTCKDLLYEMCKL
jgi:tubulin--tyrosine ligase-like protein 12